MLEVLCSKRIHVTKIFNTQDGFPVLLLDEEHADYIFTREIKGGLHLNDFQPLMAPELKVKKSGVITRLDEHIYNRNKDDILNEILAKNTWIGDEIDSICKFPNSPTIQLTFT